MNKNKIIFLILWIITIVIVFSLVMLLSKTWETKRNSWTKNWDFTIWVLQDSKEKFSTFINDFKSNNTNYKNTNFNIVSFGNYEEYYNSLIWSFLKWSSPDIFVINNNDSPIFEGQISWLDPEVVSPDDFRKNYDIVFSNDLIKKTKVNDKDVEYLVWIPMWYENLWLFYNFREVKWKTLSTWSHINEIIKEIRDNNWKVAIWLWNWTTVKNAWDIITQFLLLEWINSLDKATWKDLRSALSNYVRFWDENLDNKYDELFDDLISKNKDNLDAFSAWDVQMVVWYPRMLDLIEKKWFSKNFLRWSTFPMYSENKWNLLINYNTFVINKSTLNYETAKDLMVYFASSEGQKKYLENFNYYMPTRLELVADRLEENIKDWYNIKYKDFYNSSLELTTFNKWIKNIYDNEVTNMLDYKTNSIELFEKFRKKVLCITAKTIYQENLGQPCN